MIDVPITGLIHRNELYMNSDFSLPWVLFSKLMLVVVTICLSCAFITLAPMSKIIEAEGKKL